MEGKKLINFVFVNWKSAEPWQKRRKGLSTKARSLTEVEEKKKKKNGEDHGLGRELMGR